MLTAKSIDEGYLEPSAQYEMEAQQSESGHEGMMGAQLFIDEVDQLREEIN